MKAQDNFIFSNNWDELWSLLRNGDKKGLEGLYRLFSNELFKYGLVLANDEDFIQDCIQEVFIDLWKYHQKLQKVDNVKVYLIKTLTYKIYRENKKKSRWKLEALKEEYTIPFSIESIESTLIGIQREENLQFKLACSLEKLPIRQKQVIQMLFFEQFSYEEISKMMGINLRSVYTLAWKAIGSLKKQVILIFYLSFFFI